jgi:endogenous inhibitor of DNA gyrase (YacG/DUF329 family)
MPATSATDSEFFPFCSERCRNVDLFRWGRGKYAIVEPLSPDQLAEHFEDELDDEGY